MEKNKIIKKVATKKAVIKRTTQNIDLDALAENDPQESENVQLSFTLSQKEYRDLTILAERKDESVASYIKRAIVTQSKTSDTGVSLNFSKEDYGLLNRLASKTRENIPQYILRTIATHKYLRDRQDEGQRILLEKRINRWGERTRTEITLDARE